MEIPPLSPLAFQQLNRLAGSRGIPPEFVALEILQRFLEGAASRKCRFPPCVSESSAGGLCPKHYGRAMYHVKQKILDRDWLAAIGRMTPRPGLTGTLEETLETLPKPCKLLLRPDEFTHWLFDHPRATGKVQRMLAEQRRKK